MRDYDAFLSSVRQNITADEKTRKESLAATAFYLSREFNSIQNRFIKLSLRIQMPIIKIAFVLPTVHQSKLTELSKQTLFLYIETNLFK